MLTGALHPIMEIPLPQLDGIVKRFFALSQSEAVAIAKALEPEEAVRKSSCGLSTSQLCHKREILFHFPPSDPFGS